MLAIRSNKRKVDGRVRLTRIPTNTNGQRPDPSIQQFHQKVP